MSRSFGNLREWRKSLDLTQPEIGEKFKINWKTYSAYETGRISVPMDLRKKFEKAGYNGPWDSSDAGNGSPIREEITREEMAREFGKLQGRIERLEGALENLAEAVRYLGKVTGASDPRRPV